MTGLSGEMWVLVGAVLLAFGHVFAAIGAKTAQYGTAWNMGARDGEQPPLNPVAARLDRAQANYYESLPLLLALVLALEITGRGDMWTAVGGWLWLAARLVYLPVYAAGVPKVRTLIHMVSVSGLLLILAGLLGL